MTSCHNIRTERIQKNMRYNFDKNNTAFTLVEVLITLSILGIVAAMAIPNVIRNYQRQVTVTKVKKMYSDLSVAYGQFIALNGRTWPFVSEKDDSIYVYENIIKPYFYIKTDGGLDKSLFQGIDYYCQDGTTSCNAKNVANRHYAVELKDGSILWFKGRSGLYQEGVMPYFIYDINGIKKPNKFGTDVFVFSAYEYELYPTLDTNNLKEFYNSSVYNCKVSGLGCTAWVIAKGNMKYLDCPKKRNWDTEKCNP